MAKLPISAQRLKAPPKTQKVVDTDGDAAPPPGTTTGEAGAAAGAGAGVSDAATSAPKGARPGGLDPDKAAARQSSGGGTLSGEGSGSSSESIVSTGGEGGGPSGGPLTVPGSEATGGFGAVQAAQDSVAARRAGLTELEEKSGPDGRTGTEVVEDAIAEGRAANPANAFRESVRGVDALDPGADDGKSSIAEQGTGAISADPAAVRAQLMAEAQAAQKAFEDKYDAETKALTDLSDQMLGRMKLVDQLGPGAVETPGGAKLVETDGGTVITTIKNLDGTTVVKVDVDGDGKADQTKITKPDGSKIVSQEGGAVGQVTETDKSGNTTTTPVGGDDGLLTPAPDTEGTGNGEFRFISEGLRNRLGPKSGQDGGDIDPVDDGGITAIGGLSGPLPDTGGLLTGGDGRAAGVAELPATSGFDGLDPSGNGGVIDPTEESADPFGGGLEDDPLAGSGPGVGLDGVDDNPLQDDDEVETGDDASEFSIGEPTLLGSGVQAAARELSVDLDTDDADADPDA